MPAQPRVLVQHDILFDISAESYLLADKGIAARGEHFQRIAARRSGNRV